jgi:hypothetical protein
VPALMRMEVAVGGRSRMEVAVGGRGVGEDSGHVVLRGREQQDGGVAAGRADRIRRGVKGSLTWP